MAHKFALALVVGSLMSSAASVGAQSGNAASSPAKSWAAVQASALKEGRVVLYSSIVPSALQRIKADFENAHRGIVLEHATLAGSLFIPKVTAERANRSDGADVLISGELLWAQDRAREGALIAPAGPNAKSWPEKYLLWSVTPILAIEPWIIAYNSNLVKTKITSYADLLKPELKGRIGTIDIVSPSVVAWYDWLERANGSDFLARFSSQNPRLYPSGTPITQGVAAGELLVGAFATPTSVQALLEQGAPVSVAIPNPGLGVRYGGSVFGWSKRPNAALVFMDYMMSPRGQTAYSGRSAIASPLPGISGALSADTVEGYDSSKYSPEVVKAYKEKMRKLSLAR